MTAERVNPYRAAIEREFGQTPPAPAYFFGSDDHFEQIGHVPARYNRAVLYRGLTLHSGEIPDAGALSSDPSQGRLTVNTFLAPRARRRGWSSGAQRAR